MAQVLDGGLAVLAHEHRVRGQQEEGRSECRSAKHKFQWWARICYVITLAVQVPFLDQLFYVGPLVSSLGGADNSWIVSGGRGASSTSSRGRRPRWVRRLKVSCGGGVS